MRNGRPASVYQQGVAEVAYTYDSGRLTRLSRKTKQSGGSWQYQYYNLSYNNWGQRTTFAVGSQTLSANTYEPNGGNLEKPSLVTDNMYNTPMMNLTEKYRQSIILADTFAISIMPKGLCQS